MRVEAFLQAGHLEQARWDVYLGLSLVVFGLGIMGIGAALRFGSHKMLSGLPVTGFFETGGMFFISRGAYSCGRSVVVAEGQDLG
jgi:hypothetical protein